MMETKKHSLLHQVANSQEQLTVMQAELEKEYGSGDINIQDGTINRRENVEADKKD